jgi:microsomal dipeptidase-like Zn-dependent dipeptidase
MIKRIAWGLLVLVLVAVVAGRLLVPAMLEKATNVVEPHAPHPVSAEARALHESLVVGDWHSDSLLWDRDLLERSTYGHVDVPRLIEGNVAIQVFTAVTRSPAGQNYERNSADALDNNTLLAVLQGWPMRTLTSRTERALYQAERLEEFAERAPDRLMIVRDRADLDDLLARRRDGEKIVGGVLGLEGSHALDGDLAALGRLFDAGYRVVGLQHFFDNEAGGSLHGESGEGLTRFGRDVVRESIARGMIVDVAHSSPQTVKDVLEMADVPVILSHTGINSHCESRRNIDDALMKRIAAGGGVIGVGYWADVVCDHSPEGVVAAIRAAIDLVGEDHVSLGSDYDGATSVTFDTSELAALTHEMLAAGFSRREIEKVMGANLVRLLETTLPADARTRGAHAPREVAYLVSTRISR